jgi:hypothetical protein
VARLVRRVIDLIYRSSRPGSEYSLTDFWPIPRLRRHAIGLL